VEHAVSLLGEGSTIPFISRYRKEATGSLDEVQIAQVKALWTGYEELEKRRAAILKSIDEQDKLTPELRISIENCWQMNLLEDLYLPYRPKRRTRAGIAREKGLGPLAEIIFALDPRNCQELARPYLSDKVQTAEEALAGARDIIAEQASEQAVLRQRLRRLYQEEGVISARYRKERGGRNKI
jgi:uncharacterized protein